MTKARDIADFKFENIVDTGTEGTKVALGTTAQRGSTQGQIRFNSTTGLAEYYTGTAFKSIDAPPTVSSVGNTNITDAQILANYDLAITGSGFNSGATVKFIGNDNTEYASPTVTVHSETSVSARVPTTVTNANEPYDVKVTNISGLSNTLADAFNVDAKPAWQTASGTLATIDDDATGTHATVSATDPEGDTVSYSETGGTVLSTNNLTLNSSTGAISGDPTNVSSPTTRSFTLRATSGTNTTDRAFNIIINPATTGGNNTYTYSYGGTNYKIHKFTSNGNFVLGVAKTIDYLIIGGGGGGGHHSGAGGGAGGLVWKSGISLSAGTYPAVIGTGGSTAYNQRGGDGTNSTFNSHIAIGGGGGSAGGVNSQGRDGGSSGGGARGGSAGSATQSGSATGGFGNAGATSGSNNGAPNYAGYGGGGAGGAGSNRIGGVGNSTFVGDAASTTAFLLAALAGTDSSNVATTGSSTGTLYIAGGGGGSDQANATDTDLNGGTGGGGNGSDSNGYSGSTAVANTGSGAGGQGWNNGTVANTNSGATGIVIVRYTV